MSLYSVFMETCMPNQWRSLHKIFGGTKCFDFKWATVFRLEHLLSKHKTTPYARNLGGATALFTHPGYAYEQTMEDTQAESIIASMLEAATLTSSVASPNIWEEPKKLGRAKMLDLRQGTLLCLKYRLSKQKLWGRGPLGPPPWLRLWLQPFAFSGRFGTACILWTAYANYNWSFSAACDQAGIKLTQERPRYYVSLETQSRTCCK